MNLSRAFAVIVVVFTMCLVLAIVFILRAEWQIYGPGGWRDEVYALTGLVASNRAHRDFSERKIRLLKLEGESKDWRFTGVKEGPYEIWVIQFYPSLGIGHRYSTEQYVEFYNRAMRYRYEHPDEFKQKAEGEKERVGGARAQTLRPPTGSRGTSMVTCERIAAISSRSAAACPAKRRRPQSGNAGGRGSCGPLFL